MSSPSQVLAHLGAPPITPTELAPQSSSTSQRWAFSSLGDLAHAHHRKQLICSSRASSHLHFLLERGARVPRLKDLQVTLLVELRDVVRHAVGQELARP